MQSQRLTSTFFYENTCRSLELKLRVEVDCKIAFQSSTDPKTIIVRDVDFGGFTYKEFLLWLKDLTKGSCNDVYYCSRKETLAEEPILDWADNEVLSDGNMYDVDDKEEEDDKEEADYNDEDDNLDDIMAYEHKVYEEVHTFNKTIGDDFLNKLSGIGNLSDDDEPNDGKDDKVVFLVHDEKQEWDKMVPIIGMKFANPVQLKLCVTNYVVKNGYDSWYSYGEELRRTNPGSIVKMDVDVMPDGTTYFSKFYVCLKGVKDGWIQGCRRVIGLDGCFLKGICKDQLLTVVGRDANNHIYPLAWAEVVVESKETWKWFVDLLLDDIEMGNGHGLTLISDQHKGSSWGDLHVCTSIRLKLSKIMALQRFWRVVPSAYQEFEVRLGYDAYDVDLGKVKVELAQEVDVASDSDSEVQVEPDSKVESYQVYFEEDNLIYEEVDQPEVEAEVQGQSQGVVGGVEEQVEVEAQVEVEVQKGEDQPAVEVQGQGEGQEGEELAALQDPIGHDNQGQDAVQDPMEEEHMQEVTAFQVLQGKRRRKPSERITKIQIRKKWEGKQGNSGENPMELE
uniref:MULE transposase domain-containing protein n=1 Tax=Lactuca sativa TaxID=4236 RepID=A0A9R1V2I5_LACSA|nr:hypothetical protein LSAT_V11C700346510 [Lactuca sativa]